MHQPGLVHYLIVRRDLPFGAILAQVTHAAGESFYQYAAVAQGQSAGAARSPEVGSSQLPSGSIHIDRTKAVVLGCRNESRLLKLERTLTEAAVSHAAIREPDAPYFGALMAIGVVPRPRSDAVDAILNEFQLFRSLELTV